jgi:hypothetical protein
MSRYRSTTRLVRVLLATVVLAAALLTAPLATVGAAPAWLQATIKSVTGATMGTATFTPGTYGGVRVQVAVSGYNPVGGDRRLTIRNATGAEVLVLPNIQFFPNGSASYETVTTGISMDWLAATVGAAIVIQADSYSASEIIGWGVISGAGWPYWGWPPAPAPTPPVVTPPAPVWPAPPYWQPPPPPPPPPAPPPSPIVGRVRVTASDGLRLRSGPGLGYAIRRIVRVGTTLESTGIYQWANGYQWLKVRYGGVYYWAASAWLQVY